MRTASVTSESGCCSCTTPGVSTKRTRSACDKSAGSLVNRSRGSRSSSGRRSASKVPAVASCAITNTNTSGSVDARAASEVVNCTKGQNHPVAEAQFAHHRLGLVVAAPVRYGVGQVGIDHGADFWRHRNRVSRSVVDGTSWLTSGGRPFRGVKRVELEAQPQGPAGSVCPLRWRTASLAGRTTSSARALSGTR